MPRRASPAIAIVVCAWVMFGAPPPADGCDCIRLNALSEDVRLETPFIFSGTVVEIVERNEHTTRTYDGGAQSSVRPLDRQVVFRVESGWRGVARERISVAVAMSDCMFPFEIGKTYLVFANKDALGRPTTNICTRTTALGEAAEITRLLGAPIYRVRAAARSKVPSSRE
jgi:hypothetical protein